MGSGISKKSKATVDQNAQQGNVQQNPASALANNPVQSAKKAATPSKKAKGKDSTPKAAVKIEIASDQPGARSTFKTATPKQSGAGEVSTPGDAVSPTSRRGRRRANDTSNVLSAEEIHAKFAAIVGHCSTHMSGENNTWDNRIAKKLCADKWDDRLDGLAQLQSRVCKIKLSTLSEDALSGSFCNIGALLVHSMNDTVRPVCISSLEVFRKTLEVFGARFRKNPTVCTASTKNGAAIADLLTIAGECLLYRMGDSNSKVRSEAQSTILDMVHLSAPRGLPIVWTVIFGEHGAGGPSNDSAILQRLVMMQALISAVGFSKKDGFTLGATMSVAVPSLAIADQKTRTAAMDLVVAAYAVAGERVNKHLHGCKPAMIKILQRKFQEHHDTELFGGNENEGDARQQRRKEARSKRAAKQRSNQHSPGASSEDEQEDSESESDSNNTKTESAIPAPLSDVEDATATANSVELLKELPGLGVVLLHKLQSDKWSDRKEGFDQVAEWTQSRETEARCNVNALDKREALADEFAAHCTLLQPAIEANVLPVVLSACSCLRRVIKLYSENVDWVEGNASRRAHYLVPALLEKANGTNQRVQREACKCLLDFCHASHGGGLQVVVPHLMNPTPATSSGAQAAGDGAVPEDIAARPCTAGGSKTGGAPKSTLRANLVLLKILLRELGVRSTSKKSGGQMGCGLSVRQIMKLTKPALIEADSKVRKSGIAVIVELEKSVGLQKVMKYLEGLKPALLTKIQLKIDPAAAAKAQEQTKKSRSALPPLSDLKPKYGAGHLAPLGSKGGGLKVLGQKASLVKPAHVNSGNVKQEPVARSLDFNSDLMDQDEEAYMSSIVGF